ncbi:T9SS type A sorting domain-containing protein [Reichenbachiella ulvae]|uniref:T9SS type A sorting domain-containing protein n=1 Tax=Reichenbachiella ulvae TaxID=2980104 RepID=A0ABT3CRA9_9BACT|nr:T9SS type A sorting domain-containing protein [Reichenbachiella ulvae]MCV9386241.1 T9SS type A sorting domain-containing protein [Reichenbachiella ulvae]
MRLKVWLTIIFVTLVGIQATRAQIIVKPISPVSYSNSSQIQGRTLAQLADTTVLPFWDDFSTSSIAPNPAKWNLSDGVYVNGNMAQNPPSFNVISFDGLDSNGTPYDSESTIRLLDILESQAIDLSQIPSGETAVFSFYFQRTGYGEKPEAKDSLRVLLKSINDEWVRNDDLVLTGTGSRDIEPFQRINFPITHPDLLHEGFQLRFENYGNPTGGFDTWHLDYILVDTYDLNITDWESITDHAISRQPTSIFKRYTNIPFDQFFSYSDSIFTNPEFVLYSLFSGQNNVTYLLSVTDTLMNSQLFEVPQNPNQLPLEGINDYKSYSIKGLNMGLFSGLENRDSLFLESKISYLSSNNQPPYLINDTSRMYLNIHETLSYDDGSAEYAGGLNQSGGEIAIQYTLPTQDTLTHVDIYFPRFLPVPTNKTLDLIIYDNLSGETGSTLRRTEIFMSSSDAINRFTRYELSRPVVLPQGDFFISLKQATNDYIPYGLDKNTNNWDRIFFKPDETWIQNTAEQVSGSFMIRAIFADNDYEVLASSSLDESIHIYPNPANQIINIKGDFDHLLLIDLSGQILIESTDSQINVSQLRNGIYLLKINSKGKVITQKLVINH